MKKRESILFCLLFLILCFSFLLLMPASVHAACIDKDNDGYGSPGDASCPKGVKTDCDDNDPKVYPASPYASNTCDGKDTNCDGRIDFSTDIDNDHDGYTRCKGALPADCNDNDPAINPGAVEGPYGDPKTCTDLVDNNCNSKIDAADPGCSTPCVDKDHDGYGNPGSSYCPNGSARDCNDNNANINSGASDANCNGIDENCDGILDNGYVPTPSTCGVGACAAAGQNICQNGAIANDCTPGAPQTEGPYGNQTCSDGIDNNCNGQTDAADSKCAAACIDNDGDDYGISGYPCPKGAAIDCNDNNPNINPGKTDTTCNGVDENCSGIADEGYVPTPVDCGTGICKRTGQFVCQNGAMVNTCTPGAPQTEGPYGNATCTDGKDNNCNNLTDAADRNCSSTCADSDGDGYGVSGAPCPNGTKIDCDDTDPKVYPGSPYASNTCDGKDTNCDGRIDFSTDKDVDKDGVPVCGGDCNDNDPTVRPGVLEGPYGEPTCTDGKDNNCNGKTDATDPNCVKPTCVTKTSPKNGPHFFTLLNPDNTVHPDSGKLDCGKCHNLNDLRDPLRYQCQRCHADTADTSDLLNGTLKAQYPLNPPYGYGSAPNVKMHSSTVIGTKYGSWNPNCVTCHNPHTEEQDLTYGTTYGMYVKEYVCFDNTSTGAHVEELIQFTAPTDTGSFADGAPHNKNVCEMCHTRTNHHRRDGTAPGDLDAGNNYVGHFDGMKCTDCHPHKDGFAPTGGVPVPPHDTDPFINNCDYCHVSKTNFSAPIPDSKCEQCHTPNGVLKPGFPTAPDVLTHSDVNGSGKYTYNNKCVDCHDPMFAQPNLKFIKPTLSASVIPGSKIVFTAYSGANSFADGAPHSENVCETCHTQTNHHRYDGSAPADNNAGGYVGHYDGSDCTSCHVHSGGFKPSCGACHDAPPPTGTHVKHFGGTKDDAEYGSTKTTKDYTSQGSVYMMGCGNCHPIDFLKHANSVLNSGGGDAEIELYDPNAPAGSMKALNPPTASYTPGSTVYTDAKGMKYTQGTCDNVYCHSYTYFTTSGQVPEPLPPYNVWPYVYNPPWQTFPVKTRQYQSPKWGIDSLGCNGCHGYPITTKSDLLPPGGDNGAAQSGIVSGGVGDSHSWVDDYGYEVLHTWNMGFGPLQCNTCHYNTVRDAATWTVDDIGFTTSISNIPIYNTAKHVNGTKDVVFTPIPVRYDTSFGTKYKDLATATFDPGAKTCTNVACHLKQTSATWGMPYRWWTAECYVCHQR